jgi:predicted metal-dependent phosphoesterase TrpH
MKVDLHIHSNWSDGSMGIPQLISFAKAQNLDAISITDHDTMAGQEEALMEGKKQGLHIINGIEISAYNPETGRKAHILGYHVKDMVSLSRACYPFLEARHRKNLESVIRIQKAGYFIGQKDVEEYAALDGIVYRQHIMHALVDRCYSSTIYGPLYSKLFGPGGIAVVNADYINAKDAVHLIKDCGGYAVLAHPFQYDSIELIPKLVEWGLTGIEYQHHTQTPEHQEKVIQIAKSYNLFLSGGSDFHGFYSEKTLTLGSICTKMPLSHPLVKTVF